MMKKLTTDEQAWLDEYIKNKFGLDEVGAGVSEEMKMAIYELLEFQVYLLKKIWTRLRKMFYLYQTDFKVLGLH